MTALIDMVRLLDRSRFEPIVLCHVPTAYSERFRDLGAKVRVLDSRSPDPPSADALWSRVAARGPAFLRRWNLLRESRRMVRTELPLARRIAAVLREEAVDLVHHNDHPRGDRASIMAARMIHVPQVCHVRYLAPRYGPLDRALARGVEYHIFVSRAVEDGFRQAVRIPPDRGRTIHEAVDVRAYLKLNGSVALETRAELGLRPHERVIVNAGRLVPWKGHVVFLEALARVTRRYPAVRGIIVGSPPATARGAEWLRTLQNTAAAHGLAGKVLFTGFRSDVHRIMGAADIVVHSSIRPEPFGRVVVEAMAAARPVIATGAGGILDIVRHGDTGLLVPPGDAPAMASAISKLLDDPAGAGRLGNRARVAIVEEFPPERFGEALMELYGALVSNHGARNAMSVR